MTLKLKAWQIYLIGIVIVSFPTVILLGSSGYSTGLLMEPVWFIVIGLGFDIVGACLIISPWLYFKRWTPDRVRHGHMDGISEVPESKKRNRERSLMLWGFVFLIFGFILQIVGNWYQNPPT